jgi:uncharacterized protein (DUF952 family)
MRVLVHLVEPVVWRAALGDGVLRSPSLADQGYVHPVQYALRGVVPVASTWEVSAQAGATTESSR